MRILALAALAIAAASVGAPAQAQTYGSNFPVCLQVYGPINYYECRYTSIGQCNQSAAGRAAQCVTNPYVANAAYGDQPVSKRFRRGY